MTKKNNTQMMKNKFALLLPVITIINTYFFIGLSSMAFLQSTSLMVRYSDFLPSRFFILSATPEVLLAGLFFIIASSAISIILFLIKYIPNYKMEVLKINSLNKFALSSFIYGFWSYILSVFLFGWLGYLISVLLFGMRQINTIRSIIFLHKAEATIEVQKTTVLEAKPQTIAKSFLKVGGFMFGILFIIIISMFLLALIFAS